MAKLCLAEKMAKIQLPEVMPDRETLIRNAKFQAERLEDHRPKGWMPLANHININTCVDMVGNYPDASLYRAAALAERMLNSRFNREF